MTPNLFISTSEADLEKHFGNEFIAHLDGRRVPTLRQFYEAISDALDVPVPDFTFDGLSDALNDLQWLEDERIVLYFTNTNELVNKEQNPAKVSNLLNLLDATAEYWKWVSDDDTMDKKELIVVLEDSPRIRHLLRKEQINYGLLSERD